MAIKVKTEGIRFRHEAFYRFKIALQVKFCFLIDSHKKVEAKEKDRKIIERINSYSKATQNH